MRYKETATKAWQRQRIDTSNPNDCQPEPLTDPRMPSQLNLLKHTPEGASQRCVRLRACCKSEGLNRSTADVLAVLGSEGTCKWTLLLR